jgi:hypothetical protein
MSRNDKIVALIAVAIAGFLVYEEFFAVPASAPVMATPNALGIPTAPPIVASTLNTSQTGSGLFANASALGSNPAGLPAVKAGPLQDVPNLLEYSGGGYIHAY